MKKITISNGETRIGYGINDLVGEARETAMEEARATLESFEEEEDYDIQDDEVVDFININKYLYDESGKMLNIHYRVANNVITETFYKVGTQSYTVTIQETL
jgi:hypothetical protein